MQDGPNSSAQRHQHHTKRRFIYKMTSVGWSLSIKSLENVVGSFKQQL